MEATRLPSGKISPGDAEQLARFCLAYASAPEHRRIMTTGRSHFMKHRIGRLVLGLIVIAIAAVGAFYFNVSPAGAILMLLMGILIGIGITWWRP